MTADTAAGGTMSIGEVARRSDTPITTLRYYERRGLIDPPLRVSGQRRYVRSVLMWLMVIRFCRVAGLSLDDIAVVLGDRSPGRIDTKRVAAGHIAAIDRQIEHALLARRMMEAAVACSCPEVDDCTCGAMAPVIRELGTRLDNGG